MQGSKTKAAPIRAPQWCRSYPAKRARDQNQAVRVLAIMNKIEAQRALDVGPGNAIRETRSLLDEISSGAGEWAEASLRLDLRDIGLPDLGHIAVPIKVDVQPAEPASPNQIHLSIAAKRNPDAFPVFHGVIGVDSSGAAASTLWLSGSYDEPAGELRTLIPAPTAKRAAETTIQNFLDDIATAVERRAAHRQKDEERYRMINRSS